MAAKRASSSSAASGSSDHAVTNAILLAAAARAGLEPALPAREAHLAPLALLSSLSTLAGCLALVGPLILARSGSREGSLGELVWLTGGLLVWLFDLAGTLQGQARTLNWATPLGERTMGLVILAVLLAGWKCGLAGRELVVDERHRLGPGALLGRAGGRVVVPRAVVRSVRAWSRADP